MLLIMILLLIIVRPSNLPPVVFFRGNSGCSRYLIVKFLLSLRRAAPSSFVIRPNSPMLRRLHHHLRATKRLPGDECSDQRNPSTNNIRQRRMMGEERAREDRSHNSRQASCALCHPDRGALLVRWCQVRNHPENGRPGESGANRKQAEKKKQLKDRKSTRLNSSHL